jgi:integrase
MACIRSRGQKYIVDWRDGAGVRRWKTFVRKKEAEAFRDKVAYESRQRLSPSVPATITVRDYAEHWLALIHPTIKPRTHRRYRELLTIHVFPAFENRRLADLQRGQIARYLAEKLTSNLSRNTVRNIHATLRAMLRGAVNDGLIVANPASELGRQLRLVTSKSGRQEEIKAMTRAERERFLETAEEYTPRFAPIFRTLASTGMRLGEALGLQWAEVNFIQNEIRIRHALGENGKVDTPKSGHGRTVDMSSVLSDRLQRLAVQRKAETLAAGSTEVPVWAFCTTVGTPFSAPNVRDAMSRVLKKANLPAHFTPHCLRHTYASLLLQQGESIVYVQRQLGHASIQLTVDTYGKWLPMGNKAAVDRLDYVISGSKMVANSMSATKMAPVHFEQEPYIQALRMEPASGIEPPTCGLRNRCSAN